MQSNNSNSIEPIRKKFNFAWVPESNRAVFFKSGHGYYVINIFQIFIFIFSFYNII